MATATHRVETGKPTANAWMISWIILPRTGGAWKTWLNAIGPQVRKEFTVTPGQTIDLGEILIEK